MSTLAHRTYEVTLKLPGLRSEDAGEQEAIAIAERLENELGATRVTIREIDIDGKVSLPFYAKAVG